MKKTLSALSFLCSATMFCASALASADKYNITPVEHAACDGDAARLCMASYPDEDKLISCMKTNRDQLTPLCLTTFDAGMKKRHIPI